MDASLLAMLAPGVVHEVGGVLVYVVPEDDTARSAPAANGPTDPSTDPQRILLDTRRAREPPDRQLPETRHHVAILGRDGLRGTLARLFARNRRTRYFTNERAALAWLARRGTRA